MKFFHAGILALLMACTGCSLINDDRDNCPPLENVILSFRYMSINSVDIFQQNIGSVDVFVFDQYGCFVTRKSVTQQELNNFQGIRFQLAPGTYRIVCWGNVTPLTDICQLTAGSTLVSNATAFHTLCTSGVAENGDPLHYAPRISNMTNPLTDAYYLTIPEQGTVDEVIDFTGAHKTIEVYVKGFVDEGSQPNNLPRIELTSISQGYTFNMQTMSGTMKYDQLARTAMTNSGAVAATTFHTPLFLNDNPILINIRRPSTGEIIYTVNLKQFLQDNNIVLTSGRHDLISIMVEFKSVGVSVTLATWGDEPVKPTF